MTATDAKRIIGKAAGEKYALDQDALGTKVISALKAAAFSIVHESEIHGATRDRCAAAAYSAPGYVDDGWTKRDAEGLLPPGSIYDHARYDARQAIRALPDGGVE